jgi:hypothetical protein
MKNNKRILVLIGLMVLVLVTLQVTGQTRKLRDIGRYRFIPMEGEIVTPEMMKSVPEKYADDIRRGFEIAGAPELYDGFMDKLMQAAVTERELAVGTKLVWMIFRSQGQIKVINDLEWAGQEPLPVFALSVQEGDKRYEIVIPKFCGNISLERVTAAPAAATAEAPAAAKPPAQGKPESLHEITRPRIYQEIADLINETDMYCSFAVWEKEMPELHIIGAEREEDKTMFSDGDVVFLSQGKDKALEPGQVFWALEIFDEAPEYGRVAIGRGRVRVLHVLDNRSVAVVENTCDRVGLGCILIPFEPKEGMMGKDQGYDVPPVETPGAKGEVVYFQGLLNQIGSLMWALVNIGEDKGLQVGQQLLVYRKIRPDLPVVILGSCVVIDVKSRTATVKTLSVKDAIRKGDFVMERPL